ncbi:class F sortase [Ferrimicrobium sp.]|uniref:class F sortase n=1 Tax=Ferrimicrobium sp. TaxID=2926050 RepID=UPI00260AAC7B|nr:class F sortase [Ferrimicrobium sp.]
MWYRRVVGVAFLVVGLGAVAVGTVGISGIFDPKSPDVKSFQVKVPPKRKLGGQVNGSPASDQYLGVPFVPLYYSIPALGLHHIRIYPEQDPHGSLVIPPIQLGVAWWEGGAKAGASTGTTLLAGHDDWVGFGNGPMQRIWYLKPGTTATLYGASGQHLSYIAVALRTIVKTAFPSKVSQLITSGDSNRLVMVTCGGVFEPNQHNWNSDVVATFMPISRIAG